MVFFSMNISSKMGPKNLILSSIPSSCERSSAFSSVEGQRSLMAFLRPTISAFFSSEISSSKVTGLLVRLLTGGRGRVLSLSSSQTSSPTSSNSGSGSSSATSFCPSMESDFILRRMLA
ncbi:MAG: hypothetical protein A4E43_00505 [Methanosaeta sp. PtaB.Bin005]|nr:MAG: hypothetical protein A4E43_00505 [Methanosaeta sp. PtaB.Bin005]